MPAPETKKLHRAINVSAERLRTLTADFAAGARSLASWQKEAAHEITLVHTFAGALANGGPDLSDDASARLQNRITTQLGYLWGMADGLAKGEVTDGQAVARIGMYARAANATFHNARREDAEGVQWERRLLGVGEHCPECFDLAARGWVPYGTLPGIGETSCLTNCLCEFEYSAEDNPAEEEEAEFGDEDDLGDLDLDGLDDGELAGLVRKAGGDPDGMSSSEMREWLESAGFGGPGSGRYPLGSGKTPFEHVRGPTSRTKKLPAKSAKGGTSLKAARAKQSHKVSDADKQRYAEEQQDRLRDRLAKHLKGKGFTVESLKAENVPVDLVVRDKKGRVVHGIELKTLVDNKNHKITVHTKPGDPLGLDSHNSIGKKARWQAEHPTATFHSVALDHQDRYKGGLNKHQYSGHEIHYQRGSGSYRLKSVHRPKDDKELAEALFAKEERLPKGGRRSASWHARVADAAKALKKLAKKRAG